MHEPTGRRASPLAKADPKLANAWKTKAGARPDRSRAAGHARQRVHEREAAASSSALRLQAQKDDLLSNAGETTEHLREDTSIVPDPADRATIEEEHALELRTRDRERKLLKKIAPVAGAHRSRRLRLLRRDRRADRPGAACSRGPTATLSLEAQQRRELKQKMFGD